jgi:hypothetical protein
MSTIRDLRALRRIAREAENTYVGRHWPSMADMRRDGVGFGLVEDRAHERAIRRYLDTFQPAFVVDLLGQHGALLAALDALVEAADAHGICVCQQIPGFPRGGRHAPVCDVDEDLRAAIARAREVTDEPHA